MPNRLENYSAQRKHSLAQTFLLGCALSLFVYVLILSWVAPSSGVPEAKGTFMLWGLLAASVAQNLVGAANLWRLWALAVVGSYVAYRML